MTVFSFLGMALSGSALRASDSCTPGKWRELKSEARVLQAKPGIARREEGKLAIRLQNGKSLEFDDANPEGAFELHRVIALTEDWVALYEPRFDSMNYRVVHLKSGAAEELDGCPVWSKNGRYFIALNEDGGSGRTRDEASLWYCARPAEGCKRIWNGEGAGRSAKWKGSLLQLKLVKDEKIQTIQCTPRGATPHCK